VGLGRAMAPVHQVPAMLDLKFVASVAERDIDMVVPKLELLSKSFAEQEDLVLTALDSVDSLKDLLVR